MRTTPAFFAMMFAALTLTATPTVAQTTVEVRADSWTTRELYVTPSGTGVLVTGNNNCRVGISGNRISRCVMTFDLPGLPKGMTVTAITMKAAVFNNNASSQSYSLFRITGSPTSVVFDRAEYDDAGDGLLATFSAPPTGLSTITMDVPLPAQAVADMNASLASGVYYLGGAADGQALMSVVVGSHARAGYLEVTYKTHLEAAHDRLYELACGSERAKRNLLKGRRLIADILVPRLWTDALHPDEVRGNAVFENAKQAVKALLPLLDAPCGSTVRTSLDDLVAAIGLVAETAYSDAVTFCDKNPQRQCDADRALGTLRRHVDNGDAHATNDRWFDAIRSYQEAWTLALQSFAKKRTIELSGIGVEAASVDEFTEQALPTGFALEGNYPNPFNPVTTIRFAVPETAAVSLVVYDVMGRQVRTLVSGTLPAGSHEVSFEARDLPSGTYLYRLTTPAGVFSKTMVLLK